MRNKFTFGWALAALLMLTSCSSKLGELTADNFTVTPSPLEAVAGQVPVTINGRFPEKYMKKKAVVEVTPVLRYSGGQATGESATFQGEKVLGNNQEISYKLGGNYTMKENYTYVDEMLQSELYLTFNAKVGKKSVEVPDVKIADGVLATSTLLDKTIASAHTAASLDAYQYAIQQTKQAQIKYLINQANIRTSELNSTSVQEFVNTLREIKEDEKGFMLDNIEISAYASPDGKLELNTALAEKRQNSSSDYVDEQLKNLDLQAGIDKKYTAEDWEGFQELVSASNIQDKEVILRVLSMYEDPEEREQQIKNLSAGFQELADEILPELRRARLTINYNLIGRSDKEIQAQYKEDASKLSLEELLYAATLTDSAEEQKDIYQTTVKLYPDDYRAYNNLATLAYQAGDYEAAGNYLAQAEAKSTSATEVSLNKSLVAIAEGNTSDAETYLGKATASSNYKEALGNLQIAQGNYAQAAPSLSGVKSNSAALAQILNNDYSSASATLNKISEPDATTSYLKAIVAARTNKDTEVISNLKEAISQDSSFKDRASKDLEFINLFNDSDFQSLVK